MIESILFIAPFKEMANIAKGILKEQNLDIPVFIGVNKQALLIVQENKSASVIISRGGTAQDLKVLPDKVIVEINSTFSDILGEIEKLVEKGCTRIAIVTRDNIIDHMVRDFKIHDIEILLKPCKTDEEIECIIPALKKQGIEGIVGCDKAVKAAQKINLVTAYINSGKIAIEKALNEAIKIVKSKELERLQVERLNAVINNIQEGVMMLDCARKPVFYNELAASVFDDKKNKDWYQQISPCLSEFNKENLIEIDNNKLLLKFIPLKIANHYGNDVLIFQEVKRIEQSERKVRLSTYHQKGLYAKHQFEDIIYQSNKMKEIVLLAKKFARRNSNILIYGETGTGKEGMAQSIHNASKRKNYPFVSVNCASLPPNLIESELFGYVDGAFTGARKSGKCGLFELAHKGTIFLDEIGELPIDIQSRLLRILQEREIMRIGDDKIVPLDLRVICATNKDLKKLVEEGLFRQDLYYRINVLKLPLPPLRERKEDILLLLQFYLNKYTEVQEKQAKLTEKAIKILTEYRWPGNVRELKNVAEVLTFDYDAVIDGKEVLAVLDNEIEHDCMNVSNGKNLIIPANVSFKKMEQEIIHQLLLEHTPEEVCAQLGMSRVTLWRKSK